MINSVENVDWVRVAALLSAGICMGIGALGPSLGQGIIGGKACEAIGKKPESSSAISRILFTACTFAETSSLYCLLISLLLILWVKS